MKTDIYAFATKWLTILRNPQDEDSILSQDVSVVAQNIFQECENFHIYASKNDDLSERSASSAWNLTRLNCALDEVKEVSSAGALLINYARALASRKDENRKLSDSERTVFVSIFNRLATICDEKNPAFSGVVKEINLVVNLARRNSSTQKREEVEQKLVVNADRSFSFTERVLTENNGEWLEGSRGQKGKIPQGGVNALFDAVKKYFFGEERETLASNADSWTIVLQDEDGRQCHFSGAICRDSNSQILDLSDVFRRTLGIDSLYVFDSNERPDSIVWIETSYDLLEEDSISPRLHESISIDVASNSIKHTIQYGDSLSVVKEYRNPEAMERLVENLKGENPFGVVHPSSDDPDAPEVDAATPTQTYSFTAATCKGKRWNFSGAYDQLELPDEWAYFISQVEIFLTKCEKGEMLLESNYKSRPRRPGEFIYLSVVFGKSHKTYYYLTDDDKIKVGDFVLVTTGDEGKEEVVQVVAKEYFTRAKAPRTPETTKYVIKKTIAEGKDARVIFL